MKILFSPLFTDFTVTAQRTIKPNTKPIIDEDGKKTHELIASVNQISFYYPNGKNEWGEVICGYGKMALDKREILALADKIREIESMEIPNGDYDDTDDLPF